MKKFIFILFTLFIAFGAYCQMPIPGTKYTLPYNNVIVKPPSGLSILEAAKGNFTDSLWHQITLALGDSSKLSATTEWVKRQGYGSGGGGGDSTLIPLSGDRTANGNINANLNGYSIHFFNADEFHISTPGYPGALFHIHNTGIAALGDEDLNEGGTYLQVDDNFDKQIVNIRADSAMRYVLDTRDAILANDLNIPDLGTVKSLIPSPAGNYGAIQLNRNLIFSATDSLIFDGLLKTSGGVRFGAFSGTSTATERISYIGVNPGLHIGPPNYNHPTFYWNDLMAIDSNVTTMTGFKAAALGNERRTYFASSPLSMSNKFSGGVGWSLYLNDSLYWNPANLDLAANSYNTLSFQKWSGYTGRSVVYTGSPGDAVSSVFSQIQINGTSSGNRVYIRGGVASVTAYLINTNGSLEDTIENYYAFNSGAAANLTPHVSKWYDLFIGTYGGASAGRIDSTFGVYIPINFGGYETRNVFNKYTSFSSDGSLHSGPTHAVEIFGDLQLKNGSEGSGKILFSDANGIAYWVDTTGLFGGGGGSSLFPVTGTGTATGDVTGVMGSNKFEVTGANGSYLRQSSLEFLAYQTDGVTETNIGSDNTGVSINYGDFGGSNQNIFNINSAGLQVILSGTSTFVGGMADSTNYTDSSFVQKGWVLAHTGGGSSYTFSTGLNNSSGTITNTLATGLSGGQTVIGGTGTTDDLIFKTTTGTAASGADMIFNTGANGGTEAGRINYQGRWLLNGISDNSNYVLNIKGNTDGGATGGIRYTSNNGSVQWVMGYSELSSNFAFDISTSGGSVGLRSTSIDLRNYSSGAVGIATSAFTPSSSAILQINSTTKGFLPPRMTSTQGSAISSPAEGLIIYVTDTNGTFLTKGWYGWNGSSWQIL